MATANEDIHDRLIRRQIDLLRFGRGFETRLIRLLDRAEPDLRSSIKARVERAARLGGDPGPIVTARLIQIEEAYRDAARPAWLELRQFARAELAGLAADEVAFTSQLVERTLPVTVDLRLPDSATLRRIVTARPFQGRLLRQWLSQWTTADRRRAMNQIRTGLLFQETPTQISRRIFGTRRLAGADGARAITRRGAATLAHTAVASVSNGAREQVWQDNADIIERVRYTATLDSRTSPICRGLDGKLFDVGKGPVPPVHIRCRSTRVPVFRWPGAWNTAH